MNSTAGLSLSILIASFIGSWHCAVMCGPIAVVSQSRKGGILPYHLGRLFSYGLLGFLSGSAGELILDHRLTSLRIFGFSLMGILLILSGIAQWNGKSLAEIFGRGGNQWYQKIRSHLIRSFGSTSSMGLGLMTIILPCGWLYSFALAAAASKSGSTGALVMILFWLGGIPALSSIQLILRKGMNRSSVHLKKISAIILIGAGVYAICAHAIIGGGLLN